MVIDLHVHTAFSDGTQTPSELLSEASMEGIDVLGVTDHDTTAGWAPAEAAARVYGLGLVRGMEISCRHEGISVHLLSYLHDPYDTGLAAVVEETRRARLDRTHLIIDRLAEDYPVDMDAVLAVSGEDATIGRPHIADALVAAGIVESRTEAFGSILSMFTLKTFVAFWPFDVAFFFPCSVIFNEYIATFSIYVFISVFTLCWFWIYFSV